VVVATITLVSAGDAEAYLDPGSGSLIIQALIALFLGASFYVATSWRKIKSYFKGGQDKKDEE